MDKNTFLMKNIGQKEMLDIIFSKYIIFQKENDLGEWFYFLKFGKIYLIKIIDNISDIDIKKYKLLYEQFQVVFFEVGSMKSYVYEDGFLKRKSMDIIFKLLSNQEKLLIYRMCQNVLKQGVKETFNKMVLLMSIHQYSPLQVKILLINGHVYFVYAESKQSDKNNQYSIPKELILDDLNLIHFVLKDKTLGIVENNVLRTEIKYTKLKRKNERYVVDCCEYQKIQKKNKSI